MPSEDYRRVTSKEELLTLVFELLDNNDAVEWENDTAYAYLQAMAAWLQDADGFYRREDIEMDTSQPSWQLIADALQAAGGYE